MIYILSSFIAAFGWGIIPLLDRYSSRYVNGLTLASSRGLVLGLCAVVIFSILLYRKENNLKEGYKKRGNLLIFLIIISPMIGFLLGHLGFYHALSNARSSIIQVVLISHCVPLIIVSLLAPLIYKDKLNWQMILGIILSILGIAITVIYNPNHALDKVHRKELN